MTRLLYAFCILGSLLSGSSGFAQMKLPGNPALRDPSICTAPDGTYYLTGTTTLPAPDGQTECRDNRGVQVWRSADLKSWEEVGYVWDMWQDTDIGHGAWQGELMPLPGLPPGDRARALTAPELHYFRDRFWIVHSMNGYAVGLLAFQGDDIQGEYTNYRILQEAGAAATGQSDGSLFVDTDGTPYLLWGGGCLGQLREDLSELASHKSRQLGLTGTSGKIHYLPAAITGFPVDDGLPEHGPFYGAFLFHDGARYNLILTAATFRDGGIHQDAYITSAARLTGPYAPPRLLIPDAGQVTAFQTANGEWQAVYASTHPVTGNYQQPSLMPLRETADGWAAADITAAHRQRVPLPQPPAAAQASRLEPLVCPQVPEDVPILMESVESLFDHPLRHTAICRGPDGTWYLTGTEGTPRPDGTIDWSRNRGIRLWSSPDRKDWRDLGYVWEIDRDGGAWHKQEHMDLTCGAWPSIGRAVTAPEFHYLNGTFYISYSMNGQGTGLLQSTSGRATGPYTDLGRLTRHGRDASLFADADGRAYWVWGQGFVASLNKDLNGFVGPVKTLFTQTAWYPRYMRRPELMGQWGSHLTRAGEWYIWTFATRTGRFGNNTIDVFASWSQSLDGPWGEPCLAISNSAQTTIVADGIGGYLASVSGEDEYSQCLYRPAISPIGTGRGEEFIRDFKLQPYGERSHSTQFSSVETEFQSSLDLWAGYPAYLNTDIRDVSMLVTETGDHYLSGSLMADDHRGGVYLYHSTDMFHWKRLGPVFENKNIVQMPDYDADLFNGRWNRHGQARTPADVSAMEMKVHRLNGHYYISGNPGNRALLKSTTGKVTGPYEAVRRVPGCCDLTQDDNGHVLHNVVDKIWRLKDIETEPFGKPYVVSYENNLQFTEDCEAGILKIDGKYLVYTTDWTGSYDQCFAVAESLEGPWSRPRIGAPYGGNGYIFREPDGSWWFTCFFNNNEYGKRAAVWCRPTIYPLHIGWHGKTLIIEPRAVRENRARLERMGVLWQRPRRTAPGI